LSDIAISRNIEYIQQRRLACDFHGKKIPIEVANTLLFKF